MKTGVENFPRLTKPRRVILEELRALKTHPTADQVYELVRRRLPNVSLGTVYRNLEVMSEAGLIRRIWPGAEQRRYDGDVQDHYHVRCLKCGRIDDVPPGAAGTRLISFLAKPVGYDVTGVYVEYLGVCPACRNVKP